MAGRRWAPQLPVARAGAAGRAHRIAPARLGGSGRARPRRGFRRARASTTPGRLWLVRADPGRPVPGLGRAGHADGRPAHVGGAPGDGQRRIAQPRCPADVPVAGRRRRHGLHGVPVRAHRTVRLPAALPARHRGRHRRPEGGTAANGNSSVGASLITFSPALPVYTGYVEDGQIYNSLGYPAGGSFIEVASEEMHLTMLPAARSVYEQENAQLHEGQRASDRAAAGGHHPRGRPGRLVLLFRAQGWLSRRTHRTINTGLFFATLAYDRRADLARRRPGRSPGGSAARHRARLRPGTDTGRGRHHRVAGSRR